MIYLEKEQQQYALIPSQLVSMAMVTIQARNKQDLLAALPFALEEELVEPVEDLHFVAGKTIDDGSTPTLVINAESLQQIYNSLDNPVDVMIPESLCLPWKPGTWSVAVDKERAIIRTGEYQGFECELDQLHDLLSLHARDQAPQAVNIWMPKSVNKLDIPKNLSGSINGYHYKSGYAEWLRSVGQPVSDLNLLEGQYKQDKKATQGLRPWLPAAVLCVCALVLHLVLSWMHISSLNSQADELDQQAKSLFKQTFPETKRIVNPRVQAEQKLKKLEALAAGTQGNNFLYVLNDTMLALKKIPSMKLNGFTWRQEQLQIQVTAPSVAEIKNVEQALQDTNYSVEMLNAVNQAGQYQAQLRISEGSL